MPLQKRFLLFFGFIFSTLLSIAQAQSDATVASENENTTTSKPTIDSYTNPVSITDSIINYGKQFLNKPYHYGSTGADSFDCSGFTSYVYKNFGYQLRHSSTDQANQFDTVKRTHLKTGDLVYFAGSRKTRRIGHVGIVVHANENGKFDFIHASCDRGITISSSEEPYYNNRFVKANRVIGGTQLLAAMPSVADSPETVNQSEIDVPLAKPAKRIKKNIPAKFHSVKSGETLSEIAEKYGLTVNELKRKNNIKGTKLSLKQKLKVKDAETFSVAEPLQLVTNKPINDSKSIETDALEASNEPTTYTVKKGETLFSISKSHHISIDELKKINNIQDGRLHLGQELKLNLKSESTANKVIAKTDNSVKAINHKVASGESLFSIAKMYNVSVDNLKSTNEIPETGIHAGQILKINQSATENANKTSAVAVIPTKVEPKAPARTEPIFKQEIAAKSQPKAEPKTEPKVEVSSDTKADIFSKPALKTKIIVHKVHAGENLATIARDFKVSLDELKRINNLEETKVGVGQEIFICLNPDAVVVNPVIPPSVSSSSPIANKVSESKPVVAAVKEKDAAPKAEVKRRATLHKVKRGENLNSIAHEFNVTVDDLKQINNLTNNKISVGQKLKIGEPDVTTSQKESVVTKPAVVKLESISKPPLYKVKKGDNLNSIARELNISVAELKKINNLSDIKLNVGQELKTSQLTESETGREKVATVEAEAKSPAKSVTYKVRRGESLLVVAKKFNLSVEELKNINNLSDNKIHSGQKLIVSQLSDEAASNHKQKVESSKTKLSEKQKITHHKVKSGESYYSIAQKFDCSVSDLKEWNNKSGNKIKPGDVLTIKTTRK